MIQRTATWKRRVRERGAQSLEWVGLGSFVLAAMTAATAYANSHLGEQVGSLLVGHLKTILGQ